MIGAIVTIAGTLAINLSKLDFKCQGLFCKFHPRISINLSKLDFKSNIFYSPAWFLKGYKSIQTGF